MESAAAALEALDAAPLRAAHVPVVMNVTAGPQRPGEIRGSARQITSPVRWRASMQQLFAGLRASSSPSRAPLTNMLKRYGPGRGGHVRLAAGSMLWRWPGGGA
jgi:malonyl CoA-acyl carrier protein transacylase